LFFQNKKWLTVLIAIGLFAGGGGGAYAFPSAAGMFYTQDSEPSVTLTNDVLQVEWIAPMPILSTNPDGSIKVEMAGFTQMNQPGAPVIPIASVLVALPPGSQPTINIQEIEQYTLDLTGKLALAPKPGGVLRDQNGEVIGGILEPSESVIPFNPDILDLDPIGVMRGINLARLVFYPALPMQDTLQITTRLKVVLHYNNPSGVSRAQSSMLDPLQMLMLDQVVNPEQVQPHDRLPNLQPRTSLAPEATSQVAIFEVEQRGITQVTYTDLSSIGFPVGTGTGLVNVNNLHFYHSAETVGDPPIEVAIHWEGDSDTYFESGERFLFYANPRFSRWTNRDTYILKEETTPGLRMSDQSANPSGLTLGGAYVDLLQEQNNAYTPDCACLSIPAGRDGDHWAWEEIKIPYNGSTYRTYNFSLPAIKTALPASLTLWLISNSDRPPDPDHQVEVRMNGTLLSPVIEWDGYQEVEQALTIPAGVLLSNASNSLRLDLPGIVDIESMFLDAFSIEYPIAEEQLIQGSFLFTGETTRKAYRLRFREAGDPPNFMALDVTNEHNPTRLTDVNLSGLFVTVGDPAGGGRHQYYLTYSEGILSPVAKRIRQPVPVSDKDYLIITHNQFMSTLSPLLSLRQDQGHQVAMVDVQLIYDNYGDGRPLPEAIHAFLFDAYHNWTLAPLYVLLVGDGTSDPKHYDPDSTNTYIPPFLVDVDPWAGETASDNRYVTVDGDDILPDILIGRLPVNSWQQAQTVVNKIVTYETTPPEGDWRQKVTFVADNADDPDSPINNFPQDAIYLDNTYIPSGYSVNHIHHPTDGDPNATRTAIRNAWNSGTVLLTYLGHGAIKRWGYYSEGFWKTVDLPSLSNSSKLPVILEMTCLTGKFQAREDDTLDESTLRLPNGGAVAVWGPTGLGLATGHVELAAGFYTEIFSSQPTDLGRAVAAGKINLMQTKPYYSDLVDTFVLLGDPATQIKLTWSNYTFIPLIFR
jgi:hypothetical protein